ncbi:winged helix-turn-helix domain-containing protein [bacterium]|nr:winged helix-turn-helix domain-containing protein [bacterium]
MQELQEQIGFSAGQIYDYLSSNNGQATFSKMKKELDLKGNFADLGLGWLAREDKVEISKKGTSVNVRLK